MPPNYKSSWIEESKLDKLRKEHKSKLIRETKHRIDLFKNTICCPKGNTINHELIYLHKNISKPYTESLTPFIQNQEKQDEN